MKKLEKYFIVTFRSDFEIEYRAEAIKDVHKFTTYLSVFLGVLCAIFVLLDKALDSALVLDDAYSFLTSAILLLAYPIAAKYVHREEGEERERSSYSNYTGIMITIDFLALLLLF